MRCGRNVAIFVLVFLYVLHAEVEARFSPTGDDVHCFNFDNACGLCIQEPLCQWCSELKETNATGYHCFSVKTNLSPICNNIENPQNSHVIKIRDEALTEVSKKKIDYEKIIQLRPQQILLQLRKGRAKNFTVSYRQVKDYPLDLYYLMDLSKSMYEDKLTLARLGKELAVTMRNLTSQFKIGFGSFVDKVMLPYVNIRPVKLKTPCDQMSCATPFSFRNNLKLIEEDEQFVRQVKYAQISTNLDSSEGGFDALMQAMVCEDQIGWRKNVRKIIVFSTDASFHFAGDGKLAGVVIPNDGECHLNEKGFYDKYDEFDYPSVGQIAKMARKKGINIIFAVKGHATLYKRLSERVKGSTFAQLVGGSSNVIDVVADVYNSITGKVEIGVKSDGRESPLSVRFFTDCGIKGTAMKEQNECKNVREGTTFNFTVEITVSDSPKDDSRETRLEIGTLQDSLVIDVDLLFDCGCELEKLKGYQENSPSCSESGTKQCGVCYCNQGFYGQQCQCRKNHTDSGTKTDQSKCRPQGSLPTDSVCSGRGRCECETCICWKERYYGRFCQCDKDMCRTRINSNVECSGNGKCDCDHCTCNSGWEGNFCECRSKHSCLPRDSNELCSGNGECVCGKCECKVSYTGKYCEECPTCGKGKCLEFRPCVQCEVWGSGTLRGKACKNCTYGKIQTLPSLSALLREYATLCTYEDELTGCLFNFTYKYTDEKYEIFAQNTQKCPEKIDILAVTLGVICGIVAIGVLTLIIWKILTTNHDRKEFLKFEKERQNAAWNREDNPLYKDPQTTVSNPAFSAK